MAVGNFDGLHVGHQALLETLGAEAFKTKTRSAVLTFNPHPADYFSESRSHFIFSEDIKRRAFAETKIQELIVATFDEKIAELSAQKFVAEVLVQNLNARVVFVGREFRFGKGRKGDFAILKAELESHGCSAIAVEPICDTNGKKIGSRRIRDLLAEGNLETANQFLGRPFVLIGQAVRRSGMGTKLGFPTINLKTYGQQQLPKNGVYSGFISIGGSQILKPKKSTYRAVFNVGFRPTVDRNSKELTVEGHIYAGYDLQRDIHNEEVAFYFERRIRDEKKFDSLEQLKLQIGKDIRSASET